MGRYLHNFDSTLNVRQIGLLWRAVLWQAGLWRAGLWRAGLSRVGLRSSPSKEERGVSDTL